MRLARTALTGDGRRHYNIAIGGGNAFAVFDGAELPAAGEHCKRIPAAWDLNTASQSFFREVTPELIQALSRTG